MAFSGLQAGDSEPYRSQMSSQQALRTFNKSGGRKMPALYGKAVPRCMEVGFELKSLSEILGHAKTSTTLDRYVHSSLDVKRINMEKLAMAGI